MPLICPRCGTTHQGVVLAAGGYSAVCTPCFMAGKPSEKNVPDETLTPAKGKQPKRRANK